MLRITAFGIPVPNGSLGLVKKVEAALLSQVSEVAVCDRLLVACAAVLFYDRNRVSLGNVVRLMDHRESMSADRRARNPRTGQVALP
jgi:hypothetical protein